MTGPEFDERYGRGRDVLRRIATHVLARAQHAATGRIGLRAAPGGFATMHFGPRHERLRVSGALLVREVGGAGPTTQTISLSSSLRELAGFVGADLDTDFSVGADTPPLGDVTAPLPGLEEVVRVLDGWFGLVARALDRVAAEWPESPTVAQLWPEHFDLALDVAYHEERPDEQRVNLGGSPGDGFHPAPYLYVGPWTTDRPGDAAWWNAPFGAVLGFDDVMASDDPVGAAVTFFVDGLARLRSG